jgi:ATP-binding protein involved in chromosome partitioning
MSAFECEHGTSYSLFGEGGGQALADETGTRLLARIPLEPAVSAGSDAGLPAVLADPSTPAARVFIELAGRIVDDVLPPIEMEGCTARVLAAVEAAVDASSPV